MHFCKERTKYLGNSSYHLISKCIQELKVQYDIGKYQKKNSLSAEQAHDILLTQLIHK